jgi:hypothetical protein
MHDIDSLLRQRTPLIVVWSLIITPIVSLGVTEFARWTWTNVPHLH